MFLNRAGVGHSHGAAGTARGEGPSHQSLCQPVPIPQPPGHPPWARRGRGARRWGGPVPRADCASPRCRALRLPTLGTLGKNPPITHGPSSNGCRPISCVALSCPWGQGKAWGLCPPISWDHQAGPSIPGSRSHGKGTGQAPVSEPVQAQGWALGCKGDHSAQLLMFAPSAGPSF